MSASNPILTISTTTPGVRVEDLAGIRLMPHVLIVEDHDENRSLIKMLLEANGYRVTVAGDGLEALADARSDPPDVIVSDVLMPKMDGFALCRAWLQDPELRAIPFIFYSGTYARSEDERFGLTLGAVRYLRKPLEAEVFLGELRAVLHQWAGRAAPGPTASLDDAAFHALHESALARTIEDKIAQLEATNRKLQQSEEKYRRIYDGLQDVYVESTLEGTILEMSPQVKTLSRGQYKREDLIGTSANILYADPQFREALLRTMKQQGRAIDMESVFRNRDGSFVPCSISATIVRGADGKPKIVGTLRDITERKRAEEALRESDERFSGAFEYAPIGVALVLPDGQWLKVNRALSEMVGYSEAELLARTFQDITYPEDLEVDLENVRRMIAGEIRSYEMEKRYVHARGHLVTVLLNVSLVRDGQGQPLYFISQIQDISARKDAETHLAQMEGRYRGLLEAAPDAMVVVNQGGEIVLLNVQAEKQFGYHRDELVGQKVKNIIPEGFAERLIADGLRSAADALAQQIGTGIELTGRRKDGSDFPIEIMLSPLESAEGILVTAAIRDISVRKDAEARIVHLNRVYAVLSSINMLIVRVHDRDELFSEACRIAAEAGGFRMAMIGIVDRSRMQIVPIASAGEDKELVNAITSILSSGELASNTMVARVIREKKTIVSNDSQRDPQVAFGRKYAEGGVRSMAILPLMVADEAIGALALYASESNFFQDEEIKLLTELAGDISFAIDHIDKRERLDYLAYYDVLTGLANRTLFLDRVAQYLRSAASGGHKLAVFLIDLERFKNINDSLGQTAGDALLRQVAEWLTLNAGDANVVARVSADHFATVLPEVNQDGDGRRLLEKTIKAFMDHPFRLNDAVFRVAAKVGVTVFPDDGTDADTLFRNAEAALKKAKASGERYLFYRQDMTEKVAGKLTLENQLRQALDNEEFVLHYQPKVNLASGKLTSAEALIRWNDPRTGLVPPGRFIPILEETGLIYDVGRWALRQAIEDYLRWRAAGLAAVRIAVNVSSLQLRNRGFIDEVRELIGIDAQAPAGLALEITESLIMEDIKHNIASLGAIRDMGVRVAIDDFGTGFSSLSYLAKLPVDTLKIDHSFVIDMTVAPEGLALVSTIINLAHSLKLKVVAEGVETEEQSRLLRLLACDEMQGFLFSKPVPVETFEAKFLAPPGVG